MKKKASLSRRPKTSAQAVRPQIAAAPVKASFPIVGIGASAGGLEVREQFLKPVPAGSGLPTQPAPPRTAADTERLYHELQVHQVELEMQNVELQKARNELEAALENYTDLYDFAPVGYFTLTADGAIQQVNLTGALLLETERSRLVGYPFGRLVAAEFRPAFKVFLQQVFANQAKQSGDFELLRQGRPARTLNIEAQCLLKGQACRAAVTDVTARKLAEAKVRVSEIRYRRLFEAAHDGVLLLDPVTCKITDANPFMTKLLGYSQAQLVGKELFEIGLLKDEVASQEMFQKLKKKHEVRYEDLPLESQTGRHQEVEVVANLYQEDGHAVIQCNIRDITARKQMEDVLRRNEALFSALVEQAPVGVYVVDARLRLRQVNPRARSLFKNVHPLIGRDFSEVMPVVWPQRIARQVVARFRHTLKTGQPYQSPEFAERRQDTGRPEVYEWQIQRVTLPAGELGVVCFFSDITERKQAETAQRRVAVLAASNQKLELEIVQRQAVEAALKQSEQQLNRLLVESSDMQEQLRQLSRAVLRAQEEERKRISRELHDVIAQTLSGINIRLATLKKEAGRSADGFDRSLAHTQMLVGKSVDIVHQFARELRPAVLDDLGLIPALHSFLKDFAARTGLHTHLTAFAQAEKIDSANRTVLFRVAQEALNNVARHAQASRVEVTLQKLSDRICLKIHDDGKAFNVESVQRRRGGKHLGLLGMRERLEMIGGCLQIESARGQGTAILAQIPLNRAQPGRNGQASPMTTLIGHHLDGLRRQRQPSPLETGKAKP
jgi:PAS domain S-box-containing protein